MTISVVIPTYNRADLLLVALSSVVAQTHPAQEILVVDDCSTDGTAQMVRRIMRTNTGSPIALVELPRHSGRPGYVRNCGIEQSCGKYIAFLDDDDHWMPEKLAWQGALHDTHPDTPLTYTDEYWMRRGTLVAHTPPQYTAEELFAAALQKCVIGPSTAMVRRDCIDPRLSADHGFDSEMEVAEDYQLWLRLLNTHTARRVAKRLTIKCEYGQTQLSKKYPYIEKFRIAALRSLLAQRRLSTAHHRAAAAVCAHKCGIWANGAAKRGRAAEAAEYERLAMRYAEGGTEGGAG